MVFDPRNIKERKTLPQDLPDDAPRDQRILALANQLHDRGITASLADAKRLAEGMVDVERKVLKDALGERESSDDKDTLRYQLQSGGSMIFDAVLGSKRAPLRLPQDFKDFVEHARGIRTDYREPQTVIETKREVPSSINKSQILFEDAPDVSGLAPRKSEYISVPKPPESSGVSDTKVEVSDSGFVVSHTESTPNETVEETVGVVEASPPEPREPPRMTGGGSDPAKDAGIDLGNIFYTGSSSPSAAPTRDEPEPAPPPREERKSEQPGKEAGIDLTDIFYSGSDR